MALGCGLLSGDEFGKWIVRMKGIMEIDLG